MRTPDVAYFWCQKSQVLDNGTAVLVQATQKIDVPMNRWRSWLHHLEESLAVHDAQDFRATLVQLEGFENPVYVHADVLREWIGELKRLMRRQAEVSIANDKTSLVELIQ